MWILAILAIILFVVVCLSYPKIFTWNMNRLEKVYEKRSKEHTSRGGVYYGSR